MTSLLPNKVPTARKDEVQRLLGQCLVISCDPNGLYLAPVVTLGGEESNIYTLVEKHFKDEYLVGGEKFWRLIRADMQVETWRPRVQGTQLKALAGARLPESEAEFENIARVIQSLQDCLKPDSSPELFMQDLRITITQIQAWWENRNRRPDGGLKRGAPTGPQPAGAKRRATTSPGLLGLPPGATLLGGLQLLSMDGQPLLSTTGGLLPAALHQQDQRGFGVSGGAAGDVRPNTAAFDAEAANGDASAATFQHNPLAALLSSPQATAPFVLNVGGTKFTTTLNTLVAAQGSVFWQSVQGQGPAGLIHRLPSGELFIDRSGDVFGYVLEFLRACACHEATFPLPNDARDLQALAREASFYQLPVLVEHISNTSIMPQPATQTYYDSLYLETGFKAIEGPEIAEMERSKMVLIQQLNHVLAVRAQQGCYVDQIQAGVKHRQRPAANAPADSEDADEQTGKNSSSGSDHQVNLYFNVLLKRVVPVVPDALMDGDDEAAANPSGNRNQEEMLAAAAADDDEED